MITCEDETIEVGGMKHGQSESETQGKRGMRPADSNPSSPRPPPSHCLHYPESPGTLNHIR